RIPLDQRSQTIRRPASDGGFSPTSRPERQRVTVRVEPFQGSSAEWDAVIRSSTGWTHFHLYDWRRIFEEVFGHECIYLAARDEQGTIGGILPLVRVRSVLFGHYLVSLPFLNYGGPLGTTEAVRALPAAAADRAAA